jgi:hypothetical protein
MNEQTFPHYHALNRVIPAMRSRGFTVHTHYGDLVVEPGDQANQVADLLEHLQRLALIQAECTAQLADCVPESATRQPLTPSEEHAVLNYVADGGQA